MGRKNEYSGEGWRLARKNGGGQACPTQNRAEQIVEGGFTFEVQQVIIEDFSGGFVVKAFSGDMIDSMG